MAGGKLDGSRLVSWHLLFSGYYSVLAEGGGGFPLMRIKEIFQGQSWVVQKSTIPKTQ